MDAEQEQRYIIDRVGEETDLEECSLCFAASCFACVSEHCTALKKLADGGCVFYKDAEENLREIRKCFYRLIQNERFDLLMKYAGEGNTGQPITVEMVMWLPAFLRL